MVAHVGTVAFLDVLFLGQLPEFQRSLLDSLRQPLETGHVQVARTAAHITYPARVQLIAAKNPCPCGHPVEPVLACTHAPRCATHVGAARARQTARCGCRPAAM